MMNKQELQKLREEYSKYRLDEHSIPADPFAQFNTWLDDALKARLPEPNAMNLATVDADGKPHSRIVLLKEVTGEGFIFYTNYESVKGRNISHNPNVALCFLWLELERQVRIEGVAAQISREESLAYFNLRPRGSRLGALASDQSRVTAGRAELERKYERLEAEFAGKEIPMPKNWGGYQVVPVEIEFWQGRKSRLHDRIRYRKTAGKWITERLEP